MFSTEEYSSFEKERLAEFRKLCVNLELNEEQKTDAQLIRWLRAREMDVTKALKMLEEHLKWRKDNQVDGIQERESLPPGITKVAKLAHLGVNKQGLPILLVPLCQQDTLGLLEEYGEDVATKISIMNMEGIQKILRETSKSQGGEVTQVVEIIDVEGYGFRQFTSKITRDFALKMQKQLDSNYPEMLRNVVMVNAPTLFYVVFRAFKPFMSKRTLEKIDIYGTDRETWKKVIRDKFPVELVPEHWGGTRKGSDEFCSQDDIWIQGPLPPNYFAGITSTSTNSDNLTSVIIKARESVEIPLDIKTPGSTILFRFHCENYDIGFQILDPKKESLVPWSRLASSFAKDQENDSVQAFDTGVYTIIFDNSYSMARSKTVYYKASVDDSLAQEL